VVCHYIILRYGSIFSVSITRATICISIVSVYLTNLFSCLVVQSLVAVSLIGPCSGTGGLNNRFSFQANCLAGEMAMYWQWTVFGVARRTAGQSPISNTTKHLVWVWLTLVHIASLVNAYLAYDTGQNITIAVQGCSTLIISSIGYWRLSKQVQAVLDAQSTSTTIHVDPTPIISAMKRVFLMLLCISSVALACCFVLVMDQLEKAGLSDPLVVPLGFAIAWPTMAPCLSLFGWVSFPFQCVPRCLLKRIPALARACQPETPSLNRYKSIRVPAPSGGGGGASRGGGGMKGSRAASHNQSSNIGGPDRVQPLALQPSPHQQQISQLHQHGGGGGGGVAPQQLRQTISGGSPPHVAAVGNFVCFGHTPTYITILSDLLSYSAVCISVLLLMNVPVVCIVSITNREQ
jgi:hypothetical protein